MPVIEICKPQGKDGRGGCKLFYTKPDSTPPEFFAFFQAAMMIREARIDELRHEVELYELTYPFWSIEAYKAFERAVRVVEAEAADDPKGENVKNDLSIEQGGDSGAFARVEAAQKETSDRLDLPPLDALEAEFRENPNLSEELTEYFKDL